MGSEVSRPQGTNGFAKRRGSSKKMSRRLSMGPPAKKEGNGDGPPSIRVGGSTGVLSVEDNENETPYQVSQSRLSLSIDQLNTPRSRSGSSSSQSPTKPKHRCSLSIKNRQLIQGCFNNPHENIGNRILKRAAERRKDFGRFYLTISVEQREQIGETIKMLLKKSVACICVDSADDELQSMAIEFGQRFVDYRLHGFKADYFAALADSTITECVLLDAAVHPAAVTLNAFSQFITTLFSSVRDGFYSEMRRLRRISNSFSTMSNGSVSRKKLSVEDALKSMERRSPPTLAAGKAGSPKEVRRGSTGTVGNQSLNDTSSPRSLSPAENGHALKKMSQSKSASPCGGSIQDVEFIEPNNNCSSKKMGSKTKRGSKSRSPTPSRKISPGSISSNGGSQMKKEELNLITAEFLSSGGSAFAKDGSNGPAGEEKATAPRLAATVAN